MGLRCKPGDLCLVIGSQFNDGKYVTVVEFIGGPIEIMHSGGKYARLCDKDGLQNSSRSNSESPLYARCTLNPDPAKGRVQGRRGRLDN
jgi:hypothetical protein